LGAGPNPRTLSLQILSAFLKTRYIRKMNPMLYFGLRFQVAITLFDGVAVPVDLIKFLGA